jgi:hypothetical protein
LYFSPNLLITAIASSLPDTSIVLIILGITGIF